MWMKTPVRNYVAKALLPIYIVGFWCCMSLEKTDNSKMLKYKSYSEWIALSVLSVTWSTEYLPNCTDQFRHNVAQRSTASLNSVPTSPNSTALPSKLANRSTATCPNRLDHIKMHRFHFAVSVYYISIWLV